MARINVPIRVAMAFASFGEWEDRQFGNLHVHGVEDVQFYRETAVITKRWSDSLEAVNSRCR